MVANKAVPRAKKSEPRSLVIDRFENVSKDVFKKYYPLITDLIGNSPGIYALYDEIELYYVGKSVDLRSRVRHHLRDRHLASWTHFSLYLVRKEAHIHEIESLLIRIANPKGNRVVPKGQSRGNLVKKLKTLIQQKQKDELAQLLGSKKATKPKTTISANGHPKNLEGLVSKRTALYREYKGHEYNAILSPKGIISYQGQQYSSPTAAARAVVKKHGAINGWWFWYIRNLDGEWVRLKDYCATAVSG